MTTKHDFFDRVDSRSRPFQPIVPLSGSQILVHDKKMLNFCSHDYLGLAESAEVKKNAMRFLLEYGVAPASTFFQEGLYNCQEMLEEKFSHLLGKEASIFCHSRFQANILGLSTLASQDSLIFLDSHCHESLKEGATKSGARIKSFKHNDMSHLESLLQSSKETPCKAKWIVTESLFGQEGDIFSLGDLAQLAEQHQALLYVDDSHAVGVMGFDGMGLGAHEPKVDVISGSFNMGCGSFGGYLAASKKIKEYLLRNCQEICLQSLPPSALGAMSSALDLIPQMEGERKQLLQRSHWLRTELKKMGIHTDSCSQLISIAALNKEDGKHVLQLLKEAHILASLELSAEESYRILFAITMHHSPEHLGQLKEALKPQAVIVK